MKPMTLLLVLMAMPLMAQADITNGKTLYQQHCMACHASMTGGDGSALFTRPNHKVTSLAGLGKQVRRCRDNLGLTLFDDQVQNIVDYLNVTYYKFTK